jgi:hypothetical protein
VATCLKPKVREKTSKFYCFKSNFFPLNFSYLLVFLLRVAGTTFISGIPAKKHPRKLRRLR